MWDHIPHNMFYKCWKIIWRKSLAILLACLLKFHISPTTATTKSFLYQKHSYASPLFPLASARTAYPKLISKSWPTKQDEIRMSPVREETSSNIESRECCDPQLTVAREEKDREPTHYQRAAMHCCVKPLNRFFTETRSWCSKSHNAFISFLLKPNLPQTLIESFSFWVLKTLITDFPTLTFSTSDLFTPFYWGDPCRLVAGQVLTPGLSVWCVWAQNKVNHGFSMFLRWFAMVYQAIGGACFRQDSAQDRTGSFRFDFLGQIQHFNHSYFAGYGVVRPSPLHSKIVLCGLCCPFNHQRFVSKFEPTLKLWL